MANQKNYSIDSQTLRDVMTWEEIYNIEMKDTPEDSKERQIYNLISGFRKFCQKYIEELEKLLSSEPHDWLERTVDNVLLDYWEPILRAAEQHRVSHYKDLFQKGYKELKKLQNNLLDKLTFNLDVHIVLYFEKTGKAKRFPFGNTFLIGIPLIDAYQGNWMAIPHELGHHIFWNARFSEDDEGPLPKRGTNFLAEEINTSVEEYGSQITNMAPKQIAKIKEQIRKILEDWTEEIFADVVGTIIAETEFAKDGWKIVTRKVKTLPEERDKLYISDGEHPIPYLVPYIRAFALDKKPIVHWKDYGGVDKLTKLIPTNEERENVITVELLRESAIKTFVNKIKERLGNVTIDKLIEGASPLVELKKFIKNIETDEKKSTKEIRMALLNPIILEKNLDWTCRNGHTNSGDISFCSACGVAHYWWNYIIK